MYYCEVDENGKCYHVTQSPLPLSESIIASEKNELRNIWDGEKWNEPEAAEEGQE